MSSKSPPLNSVGKEDHHRKKLYYKENPIAKALRKFKPSRGPALSEYKRSKVKEELGRIIQDPD